MRVALYALEGLRHLLVGAKVVVFQVLDVLALALEGRRGSHSVNRVLRKQRRYPSLSKTLSSECNSPPPTWTNTVLHLTNSWSVAAGK